MPNSPLLLRSAPSEDTAFENVIADIPLFCVGLMAMGSITFIFVMKRVNSTALYLCIASLLLFISAILDLGQLLIHEQVGDNNPFYQDVVAGFVIAREIGLGLSSGFLFLFIWRAVAQCPGAERPESLARLTKPGSPVSPHSASWTRWGVLGAVLKWFTLVLALVIPLLQITWRLVNAQRQYESVYIADSTLEVVISAIFILKIILNVLISPSISWWPPFRSYAGLVLGLFITGAMGVGNLISFAFSETVLGRFLGAISVYVFLLWNLINMFHKRHIARPRLDDQEALTTSAKLEKPKDLTIKKMDTELSRFPQRTGGSIVALNLPMSADNQRPSLRISTASRFSVIVDRVEKNEALAEITRTLSSRSIRKSPVTTTPKRPKRPELRFDIITPTLPSTAEASGFTKEPPTTGISLSYYTMNSGPEDGPIIQQQPVNTTNPSVSQPDWQNHTEYISHVSLLARPSSQIASISSIDELMRQQSELDKSIAKLKLISVDMKDTRSEAIPALDDLSAAGEAARTVKRRSQSTRTDSLSPHSEFSLSVFPIPPPVSESTTQVQSSSKSNLRKLPDPPAMLLYQGPPSPSVSEPPSQASMAARMVSGGNQYDITSFIGNLTEPDSQVTVEASHTPDHVATDEAKIGRELLPLESGDRNGHSHLKPMLLPTVANRKIIPLPSVRPVRNTSQSSPYVGPRDSSMILKPFLLGTSVTSIPPHLPSSTMVPLGSRRGSRTARVPTNKSRISVPRLNTSEALDEDAPDVFERPRPPPLLIVTLDRPKA